MVAIAPQLPAVAADAAFPLVLNTGRIRDQWHTMTRTGKVPRLNAHVFEQYVQVQTSDARRSSATGRRTGTSDQSPRQHAGSGASQRGSASGFGVRAHALERCLCQIGTGGRTGRADHRSDFWAAGIQAYAGSGSAVSSRLARIRVEPHPSGVAGYQLLRLHIRRRLLATRDRRRNVAGRLAHLGTKRSERLRRLDRISRCCDGTLSRRLSARWSAGSCVLHRT